MKKFKCPECKKTSDVFRYQEIITGDVFAEDNNSLIYDDYNDCNYVIYLCPVCEKDLGNINIEDLIITE